MSNGITIDSVRLALDMQSLRAQAASANIANASRADARAMRVDLTAAEELLGQALQLASGGAASDNAASEPLRQALDSVAERPMLTTDEAIQIDAEVGDMVSASTRYQTLSETLSRYFGLMRLSISGRV